MSQLKLNRIHKKLDEAEGYLMLDMPERALELLRSNDDWSIMKFEACLLEGEAWRMLGQVREALVPLEVAASIRPTDVTVAVALGWCYKRTNQLAQAIDALTRSLRQHPEEAILHYNLACYWSLAGDAAKALAALAIATRIEPRFLPSLATETDFDPIRTNPAFERLVERLARAN